MLNRFALFVEKHSRRNDLLLVLLLALGGIVLSFYVQHKPLGDFGNYYFSGKMAFTGQVWEKVYDVFAFNTWINEPQLFLDHTSVPPQSILLFYPLQLFADPYTAKLAFNVFGSLLFAFACWYLLRSGLVKRSVFYVMLVPALVPFYYNILFGQTYLLLGALLIFAVILYEKKHWLAAAGLLAVVIAFKITPVVLLVYFLWKKDFRFAGATVLFSLLLLGLTVPFTGMNTITHYYNEILPRMLQGYVSDPYSESFHGFIVLLRKLFSFDAVLNPAPAAVLSDVWIAVLNTLFTLGVLLCSLMLFRREAGQTGRGIFLLLLFTNLCSGYNSSYALLLFLPFLPGSVTWKDKLALLLLALVLVLPPRLFENQFALLAHYKLILFLGVLLLLLPGRDKNFRFAGMNIVLPVLFLFAGLLQLLQTRQTLSVTYYNAAQLPEHFILDYNIMPGKMNYTYWGYAGKNTGSITIPDVPYSWDKRTNELQELPGHWQVRNCIRMNGQVIFLSDYKRGVGLYHVFCMPEAAFDELLNAQNKTQE
jgi:hypothetical protein